MPTARDAAARLLERVVEEAVATHPDPRVAARWADMARRSVARHPGPPAPTRPVLELPGLDSVPVEVRERIALAADAWLVSYLEDVRAQLMAMHREALTLQRRVAELEVASEDGGRGP